MWTKKRFRPQVHCEYPKEAVEICALKPRHVYH